MAHRFRKKFVGGCLKAPFEKHIFRANFDESWRGSTEAAGAQGARDSASASVGAFADRQANGATAHTCRQGTRTSAKLNTLRF